MTSNLRFLTKLMVLFAVVLLLLACSLPIGKPAEHVSQQQLEDEIDAGVEEFFNEFENGDVTCTGEAIDIDIPYEDECAQGYSEGKNIQFGMMFVPGATRSEDRLDFMRDGIVDNSFYREGPYSFCAGPALHVAIDGTQTVYRDCVHLNEFGFTMTVEREAGDSGSRDYSKCYEIYYSYDLEEDENLSSGELAQEDEENPSSENAPQVQEVNPVPAEIPAPAEENTDSWPSQAFDGEWKSPQRCEDADEGNFDYRWSVSLIANGPNAVVGTIQFHDCPGGGRVAYYVKGEAFAGQDEITLDGSKTGGGGDLHEFSADNVVFIFSIAEAPYPNLAGN